MEKKLPQHLENKIFYYLGHPISDILRQKVVILKKTRRYRFNRITAINFTDQIERGFVIVVNRMVFQTLWDAKIQNQILIWQDFLCIL